MSSTQKLVCQTSTSRRTQAVATKILPVVVTRKRDNQVEEDPDTQAVVHLAADMLVVKADAQVEPAEQAEQAEPDKLEEVA